MCVSRGRKGKGIRTDTIPHEPAVFVANELIKVNGGLLVVALLIRDGSAEDVAVLQPEVLCRSRERHCTCFVIWVKDEKTVI